MLGKTWRDAKAWLYIHLISHLIHLIIHLMSLLLQKTGEVLVHICIIPFCKNGFLEVTENHPLGRNAIHLCICIPSMYDDVHMSLRVYIC